MYQTKLSFERTNPSHLKTYRKPSSSIKRGDSSQQNRSLEFGLVKPSDIKSFFGRSGSGAVNKRDSSSSSLYDPDSVLNSYSCICRSDLNIRDYLPNQAFAEELESSLSRGYSFYQGLTIHSCWMEPEDRLKREGSAAWSLDLFQPMQRQAPEYIINTDEESRDIMEIQYSQQQLDGAYMDQSGPSSTEIPTDYPDEHIETRENEYLRPDILFQQQDSHITDAVVASHTQSPLNQVSPLSNRNWLENEDDSPPYDSSEEEDDDDESAKISQKRARNVLAGSSKVIVITDDDFEPTTKMNNTSPSTDRKSIRSISERKRKSSNVFSKRITAELSSSSLDFTAKDVERGSSKRQSRESDDNLLRAPLFDTVVSPAQNLRVVHGSAAGNSELFDKELAAQLGFSSGNDEPIFVGECQIDNNQQKSPQTPKRSSRPSASFLPNETIVIDSSDDDQTDEIEDAYQSTRINAGSSSSRSKVSRPGVIDVLSDNEEDKENNSMSPVNEMSDELKNFLKTQFEPREKKRKGKIVDEDGLPLPASRKKKTWPGNRGGGRWRGRGIGRKRGTGNS